MFRQVKFSVALFASFTIFFFGGVTANGQYIVIRIDATNDGTETTQELLSTLKQATTFEYQNRVEQYREVLELDEVTGKKLAVAAKGAAVSFVREASKPIVQSLRRYQQQAGLKVDMNDLNLDDDKQPDDDDKSDDDNGQIGFMRAFSFSMQVPKVGFLEKQPIWQKTVAKLLTGEQITKFNEIQAERDLKMQEPLVDAMLVKIKERIFASDDQVEQLRPIISQEFGPALLNEARSPSTRNTVVRINALGQAEVEPPYYKQVAGILNSSQQLAWKRKVKPELDKIVQEWNTAQRERNAARRALGQPLRRLALPAVNLVPAKKKVKKKD